MTEYLTEDEIRREREAIAADLATKQVGTGEGSRTVVVRSHANTAMIFERDPVLKNLGTNVMGHRLAWRVLPPWRPAGSVLRPVTNHDLAKIEEVLNGFFGGEHSSLSERAIATARTSHAGSNPFSPWRDYIDGLPEWDGVERIAETLPMVKDAGGPYARQSFVNFWLSLMMRCYDPGCQVDSMLVLHGPQGFRKTSFFRAIPPVDLPIAELPEVPSSTENKDLLASAHEAPIALIDELDKLRRKADQSAIKAFVTGRRDTWRAPYGKVDETVARSFVLAGTTNLEEFLLDATGNRRYWILQVEGVITPECLTRERMDLLLAEARDRYLRGERLDFGPAYEALADAVREQHLDDPIRDAVYSWLDDPVVSPIVSEAEYSADPSRYSYSGVSIDVTLVSVPLLCRYVEGLQDVNPLAQRDAPTVAKIVAAMNAHPRYQRAKGRKWVAGKQERRAWEQIALAPASAAAVQQALANPTASASEASQPEPKPSKPVAKPRKPKKAASQVATQPLWSAGAGDLLNPPYDLDVPAGGDAA